MSLAFAQQVYACSNIRMNQKVEEAGSTKSGDISPEFYRCLRLSF